MKLFKLFIVLTVALVGFTACKKDSSVTENVTEPIKGSYEGWTLAKMGQSEMPMGKCTLLLTPSNEREIDVKFVTGSFGTYEASHVMVTKNGNTYSFSGKGEVTLTRPSEGHTAALSRQAMSGKKYPFTFAGSVEEGKKNPKFKVDVSVGAMGAVVLNYKEGEMPKRPGQ